MSQSSRRSRSIYITSAIHCHASFFFFFNDTATTEIYTLSLHDALPILPRRQHQNRDIAVHRFAAHRTARSEEHTSELQSPCNLVCRLLLEKKNNNLAELAAAGRKVFGHRSYSRAGAAAHYIIP